MTRWGRWDPGALNVLRAAWGDSRGLNSLEILGLLAAGMAATAPASADHALFAAAFDQLAGAHDYTGNMLNLKIIAPSDENASDDELALFAYFGAMWGGALRDASPFNASLARTLGVLRDTRSALWSSLGVVLGALRADDPRVADDTLWNLRVWPVDAVDWPVQVRMPRVVLVAVRCQCCGGASGRGVTSRPCRRVLSMTTAHRRVLQAHRALHCTRHVCRARAGAHAQLRLHFCKRCVLTRAPPIRRGHAELPAPRHHRRP